MCRRRACLSGRRAIFTILEMLMARGCRSGIGSITSSTRRDHPCLTASENEQAQDPGKSSRRARKKWSELQRVKRRPKPRSAPVTGASTAKGDGDERVRSDSRTDRPFVASAYFVGFPFKRLDYSTLNAVADYQPALRMATPSNRR